MGSLIPSKIEDAPNRGDVSGRAQGINVNQIRGAERVSRCGNDGSGCVEWFRNAGVCMNGFECSA